jgi:hypothetical protein
VGENPPVPNLPNLRQAQSRAEQTDFFAVYVEFAKLSTPSISVRTELVEAGTDAPAFPVLTLRQAQGERPGKALFDRLKVEQSKRIFLPFVLNLPNC